MSSDNNEMQIFIKRDVNIIRNNNNNIVKKNHHRYNFKLKFNYPLILKHLFTQKDSFLRKQ